MPRTRAEHARFHAWVQDNEAKWSEIARHNNPRGQHKPQVVYRAVEDAAGSQEGYRILWYHSGSSVFRCKPRDFGAFPRLRLG
jgi:hypothetical protein